MKALTLTQPFATLVAIGAKKIETRSWYTSYRGLLAIHAAKGFPKWAKDLVRNDAMFMQILQEHFDIDASPSQLIAELPLGKVLCTCELVDCVATETLAVIPPRNLMWQLTAMEKYFGDYSPKRFGWILQNVQPLEKPVPATGALSLWEWRKP